MSDRPEIYTVDRWSVFGRNTFNPPFKISDSLINEARIVHVIHGHSCLLSANQRIELVSGETLIMKSDNFVNSWLDDGTGKKYQIIAFNLTADFLRYIYGNQVPDWFSPQEKSVAQSLEKVEQNELVNAYFENLALYLNNPNHLKDELIINKAKELISLLVQVDSSGRTKRLFGNLFSSTEYDFQDTIQKNLFEDLSIEEFSFLLGLSPSSFKRKFKSIYGTSPNKYITSKRLEKAQTLLSTTDNRISEIAYDCGFTDVGYFSKIFRGHLNVTPSEYRKQYLT